MVCAAEEGGCAIFLMTNCRNESALDELSRALPTPPVRYTPPEPRFEHEGRRLVVEQAIARRAVAFVRSPRSAVSDLVEAMRRQKGGTGQALKTEL